MKVCAAVGLLALAPLPLAPGLTSPRDTTVMAALCTASGQVREIALPIRPAGPPGEPAPGCAIKGCHAASERRRGTCHF